MTSAQTTHERYWRQEKTLFFSDYERNWVLPPFFHDHQLVLDLGCGDGAVGEYLVTYHHCRVVGLDFSLMALQTAAGRGIGPVSASVDSPLPFKSNTFDLVFFGDVIEHIYKPGLAIQEISRVLKPKGRLLVSCPNMGYWRYRWHYLRHGIFPETEWIEQELWQSQHIRFFTRDLLEKLLKQHHLQPTTFVGISRRRLDQPLLRFLPSLFGMIMLVEAVKT